VISHETIRQHLLQTASIPKKRERVLNRILFAEVVGIHIKRQGKRKRSKEGKIVVIYQGWEVNERKTSIIKE